MFYPSSLCFCVMYRVLFLFSAIMFTLRVTMIFTLKLQRTSIEHQQLTRHHKTLNLLQHWCLTHGGSHRNYVGVRKYKWKGRKRTKLFVYKVDADSFTKCQFITKRQQNDWRLSTVELCIETKTQQIGITEQSHTVEISLEEQPHRRLATVCFWNCLCPLK
jgi:hypothetical protein